MQARKGKDANLPNCKQPKPPGIISWETLWVIALMKPLQFPTVHMNANRSRGCINKGHHRSPSDAIAWQSVGDVSLPLQLLPWEGHYCVKTRILSMGLTSQHQGAVPLLCCSGQSTLGEAQLKPEEVSIKAWEKKSFAVREAGTHWIGEARGIMNS